MGIDINYTAWRFWFDVVQTAGTIAIGAYVWWVNRKKTTEKRLTGIEARQSKMESTMTSFLPTIEKIDARCGPRERRIDDVEKEARIMRTKLDLMPSHKDMKELSSRIDQLHGSLSEFNGRLKGINRAVDLMNEYLINQGKA